MNRKTWGVVAIAAAAGAVIGYVDSRPGWDDTGVTAGTLLLAGLLLALIRPRAAWPIGLALGIPVVVFNAVAHGGPGAAPAVGFGLAGAALGYGLGRLRSPRRD